MSQVWNRDGQGIQTSFVWVKEGDIVCIVPDPVATGSSKRVFQMSAQEVNRIKEKNSSKKIKPVYVTFISD